VVDWKGSLSVCTIRLCVGEAGIVSLPFARLDKVNVRQVLHKGAVVGEAVQEENGWSWMVGLKLRCGWEMAVGGSGAATSRLKSTY
jgi:hypothetical protein